MDGMNSLPRYSLLCTAVLFVLTVRPAPAGETLRINGETMGTYYAVTIDSPAADDSEARLRDDVEQRLREINAMMSTWDDASEISRFNQSKSMDWFDVSSDFAIVVAESLRIHNLTGGAFDPTVSPLIDLWGFGKPDRTGIPNQETIDAALRIVGMSLIDVQLDPPALRKQNPAVQLNLSAIAKGYGVDAIAALLRESGRPSFVVDIGGESRTGIVKASGAPWKVGIESPESGVRQEAPPMRVVPLTQESIATSGDYRNKFEWQGILYSHTINPATGRPVKNPPSSVSVIHESCMTADGFATAMMVLGPDKGTVLADELGLSVLFQIRSPSGQTIVRETGRFAASKQSGAGTWVPFVAAGVVFLLALGGMAIGIMISNREIKGSCGGLASLPGNDVKSACELCSIPREDCVNEELRKQMQASGDTSLSEQPAER